MEEEGLRILDFRFLIFDCDTHAREDGELFGVHLQLAGVEEGLALARVALDGGRLGEDKPFFHERLDDSVVRVALLCELGDSDGLPSLREKRDGRRLQRRFLF